MDEDQELQETLNAIMSQSTTEENSEVQQKPVEQPVEQLADTQQSANDYWQQVAARAEYTARMMMEENQRQRQEFEQMLKNFGAQQQQPETPPEPEEPIAPLIEKIKDEWSASPELGKVLELVMKKTESSSARALTAEQKAAEAEAKLQKILEAREQEFNALQEKTQQTMQEAINKNHLLSEWQKDKGSWDTVQELWGTIYNNPAITSLSMDEQMTKLANMASNVLVTPKVSTQQTMPKNVTPIKPQPPVYSVGDIPGQPLETPGSRSINDMSMHELDRVLSGLGSDAEFEAFLRQQSA